MMAEVSGRGRDRGVVGGWVGGDRGAMATGDINPMAHTGVKQTLGLDIDHVTRRMAA